MKKQWMFFMAAMTALCVTACGNGDGIVINGTTAAEAGSGSGEPADSAAQETGTGTRIEIITDETSLAEETAPESQENYSQGGDAAPILAHQYDKYHSLSGISGGGRHCRK